jgi:rhodanese-related sulfurtransferase
VSNTIDAPRLRAMIDAGDDVLIVDVRTPSEFASVHIPGAYNVPLDTLGEHASELARRVRRPVVLVCASGARAAQAERRLAGAGMGNLKLLTDGISGWEAQGGDVLRAAPHWGLERQVRAVAGSIVFGSVLASFRFPRLRVVAGGIGAGLLFSAVTNTCGMAALLAKLPYNRGATCDVDAVVAALTAPSSDRVARAS